MRNKLKIAIPTDDGRSVKPGICRSRGFVVATLDRDILVRREMRWNLLSEMMTSEEGILYNLHDCDLVLVTGPVNNNRVSLKKRSLEVIITGKSRVDDALLAYLNCFSEMPVLK